MTSWADPDQDAAVEQAATRLSGAYIDGEDAHDLAVALAQLAMLTPDTALDHTIGVGPALVLDPPPVAVARALAVVQFLDQVIAQAFRAHTEQDPHIYPDGSRA